MARRHEIQNLLRRGNVYYWRARVPAPLGSHGETGRLSLSLRFSDHRKAGYIARRLNSLLHDLMLRPNAKMTTKEQLAALFRAEIDRMHEHLDDLAVMSRRMGSADDVGQLEADSRSAGPTGCCSSSATARRSPLTAIVPAGRCSCATAFPRRMSETSRPPSPPSSGACETASSRTR